MQQAEGGAAAVPQRRLRTGAALPAIGFGTFGSDRYGARAIADAAAGALTAGYRLLDCASVYGNEREIGAALRGVIGADVPRDDVFVMTKIWNDAHAPADARRSVERSMRDLGVDVLDACYVHWPFPNHHPPSAGTDARDPDARPYEHQAFMATWGALEALVDEGLVRHLGTSNVTLAKLALIEQDARIQPALNEMELHPTFQQGELFQHCLDVGIQPVGYSPLGSPSRPARDRTATDVADVAQPAIVAAAEAHGVHPALICLKWAVQRGQVPIPFAVKPEQYVANLQAVMTDPLTRDELHAIRGADQNDRLIKGQVFLWPGADSWLDLWDVDGRIAGRVDA
ncbi:aldo/keto reductase [uncultured Amnibacterium sp.]|uniref:aldo/keto reductase n=1 Tax=uncultured Amnibacterium sp. TaxID=1631851 RepID=UPI0035C9B541